MYSAIAPIVIAEKAKTIRYRNLVLPNMVKVLKKRCINLNRRINQPRVAAPIIVLLSIIENMNNGNIAGISYQCFITNLKLSFEAFILK